MHNARLFRERTTALIRLANVPRLSDLRNSRIANMALALHRLLALLDALRTGRAHERALAIQLMEAALTNQMAESPMRTDDPNLPYLRHIAEAMGEVRANTSCLSAAPWRASWSQTRLLTAYVPAAMGCGGARHTGHAPSHRGSGSQSLGRDVCSHLFTGQ